MNEPIVTITKGLLPFIRALAYSRLTPEDKFTLHIYRAGLRVIIENDNGFSHSIGVGSTGEEEIISCDCPITDVMFSKLLNLDIESLSIFIDNSDRIVFLWKTRIFKLTMKMKMKLGKTSKLK